jgi:hypothetical protein
MGRRNDIAVRGPSGRAGFPQIRRGALIRAPAIRICRRRQPPVSHHLAVRFRGYVGSWTVGVRHRLSQHAQGIEKEQLRAIGKGAPSCRVLGKICIQKYRDLTPADAENGMTPGRGSSRLFRSAAWESPRDNSLRLQSAPDSQNRARRAGNDFVRSTNREMGRCAGYTFFRLHAKNDQI